MADADASAGQVQPENEASIARYFRVAATGMLAIGVGLTFPAVRDSIGMPLLSCVPGTDASQAAGSLCGNIENLYWVIEYLLPLIGGVLLLVAIMGALAQKAGNSPT